MTLASQPADKRSPVRTLMAEEFPKLAEIRRENWPNLDKSRYIAPPDRVKRDEFGIVGMALDYWLRSYWNTAPMSSLIAYKGTMDNIAGAVDKRSPGFFLSVGDSDACYDNFLECSYVVAPRVVGRRLSRDEDELNAYCVALACMEQMAMPVRYLPDNHPMRREYSSTGEMLDISPDYLLEDLRQLSWALLDRHEYLLVQSNIPNPTFSASRNVGGARMRRL